MTKGTKLVSISLLAACIVAILLFSYRNLTREHKSVSSCVGNLKIIAVICAQYETKHGSSPFDIVDNTDDLFDLLVQDGLMVANTRDTLKCGEDQYEFVYSSEKESAAWNQPVLRDGKRSAHSSSGINVLYKDGHVEHALERKANGVTLVR